MFVTVALVPALKYPANPPAVGSGDTIGDRTALYFGFVVVSVLTAVAATESYAVGAAAALPCFWIYAEVGRALAASAAQVLAADPNHPYAQWVTTYDAPEFQESASRARELVDEAAAHAGERERAAMATAFTVATRFELLFWDTALNPQPWPAA